MPLDKLKFFRKCKRVPSGCVEWQGAHSRGYGVMRFEGRNRQVTHISWFIKHGIWPTQHILHRCDNPPCVRPDHLFEGDDLDNARDRDAKGRHRVPRGEACSWSKLTDTQVEEIRRLVTSRESSADIAERYGVTQSSISRIMHSGRQAPRKPSSRHADAARILFEGGQLTFSQLSEQVGLSETTLKARYDRGLRGDDLTAPKHRAKRKTYTRRK